MRIDGRAWNEMRPVHMVPGFIKYPEGSVLIRTGDTWVLCNATVEDTVPPWLAGKGKGWVTADYAMLPRSTLDRMRRDRATSGARGQEITRLVGRSLRAAVDLSKLGERTITIDCEVLQADGGTRTASVTGGYVALVLAIQGLLDRQLVPPEVLVSQIAAVSVGLVDGRPLLDLQYEEDSAADADVNVVMTGDGRLVEVQGTAEGAPFSRSVLDNLLDLAWSGIEHLLTLQQAVVRQGAARDEASS
ncbi:MAG TPA: ribonuclease PH [Anaerolineae bacterium]|nr:ribonuclease PH [Anaerolineae bacterium]